MEATTSPQSMHLKQFKWKTVPNARTNGPCITLPHDEHVADTVTIVEEVVVEDALDEGGGALSEVDELERAEENDATLLRFSLV